MPASTASNFDRVFGPLWIVLAERETECFARWKSSIEACTYDRKERCLFAVSYHLRRENRMTLVRTYLSSNTLFYNHNLGYDNTFLLKFEFDL